MKSRLKMGKLLLVMAFAGLTLFACDYINLNFTPKVTPPPKTTGITGQVLRGPVHSTTSQAGDSDYIGFGALFYVQNDQGQVITNFNSDASGWFRLALDPGNYQIIPDASAPLMTPGQSQPITVVKDEVLHVILHFDPIY